MSSIYLTSEDMNMLERLLAAVREIPRNRKRETGEAKFLVNRFQHGMTNEDDLRRQLAAHIRVNNKPAGGSNWTTAEGASRRGMNLLFRLMSWRAGPVVAPPKRARPLVYVSDAQRLRDNDTDGQRRRDNEIKSRNQMH